MWVTNDRLGLNHKVKSIRFSLASTLIDGHLGIPDAVAKIARYCTIDRRRLIVIVMFKES